MNTVSTVSRIVLGLLFTVFGLNGFLNFLPMPPLPEGLATQFLGALMDSHFMTVVFAIELVAGVLLLANRYVPLALAMLSPVIVNIVLFHALMEPNGAAPAILASVLWLLTIRRVWPAFAGLFEQRA
ncbi:MAG: hypothetical protein ABI972_22250 [Acidobacteriota bacterium]